jgi:hypothetical protein
MESHLMDSQFFLNKISAKMPISEFLWSIPGYSQQFTAKDACFLSRRKQLIWSSAQIGRE